MGNIGAVLLAKLSEFIKMALGDLLVAIVCHKVIRMVFAHIAYICYLYSLIGIRSRNCTVQLGCCKTV